LDLQTNETKRNGKKVKEGLGFEGIKGGKKGKERAFFWLWFLLGLDCLERGLTDFLVGVGKPQHIVSGSSALEAS
jgi:hypothetical protein